MGTCGLANGAQQIHDAILAEAQARDLYVSVIPVGCVGYCAREVIVDIKLPGRPRISYAQVTLRDVPALVERTLIGGEVIEDKLLGLYSVITSYSIHYTKLYEATPRNPMSLSSSR